MSADARRTRSNNCRHLFDSRVHGQRLKRVQDLNGAPSAEHLLQLRLGAQRLKADSQIEELVSVGEKVLHETGPNFPA